MITLEDWAEGLAALETHLEFDPEFDIQRAIHTAALSHTRNKSPEDVETLRYNIDWLVVLAQQGSVAARTVLSYSFFPFIIKYSSLYYNKYCRDYQNRIDFFDVIQDGFEQLLEMIDMYDPKIASFTYFISKVLKARIKKYVLHEMDRCKKTPLLIGNNTIDPAYGDRDSIFNSFIGEELLRALKDILQTRKNKARSDTVIAVCDEFFLGNKSCQRVADDRNVSYHAVYEIIGRIQGSIAHMLRHNQNCGYIAILKAGNAWVLKRKERSFANTYIDIVRCRLCGHTWTFNKKDRTIIKCSKCSSYLWSIEKNYTKFFS